jgi:hypothetical protein
MNATRRFADWCASKEIHEPVQVQPFHVAAFVHDLQHLGEASGSWDVGGQWYVDADANVLRCADVWYAPGVNVHAFINATQRAAFAPGMGLPGRV